MPKLAKAKPTSPSKRPPTTAPGGTSGREPGKAPRLEGDGFDAEFVAKLTPYLRLLRGYTRLKADGLEHIPPGPAILAANHTGWLGLDYALTALVLHDELGRTPRGLVHAAWFRASATADFARKVGFAPVSKEAMAHAVRHGHLAMVFPEGEKGAFRPDSGYQVSEFARGFVRVAIEEGVPIVPVAILGGEESNPVGRTIDTYEELLRMPIPVPKNVLPKPVKWRIRVLPRVKVPRGTKADDRAKVHAIAAEVRGKVQAALDTLKVERGHPYF